MSYVQTPHLIISSKSTTPVQFNRGSRFLPSVLCNTVAVFDFFSCCVAGECEKFVEFFFIDTTPFVDEYWNSTGKETFDWRGLAPREEQLWSQLQVCISILVTCESLCDQY